MLDRESICRCLKDAGYDAELTSDGSTLTLAFDVGERRIELAHLFRDELLRTPIFCLVGGYDGNLAHVLRRGNGGPGEVCIGDPESTAVNTDRPGRVYLEAVEGHVELLTRLIQDPDYNRVEQLREFDAHWGLLCRNSKGALDELFVVSEWNEPEVLQVFRPSNGGSGSDLHKTPIALPNAQKPVWASVAAQSAKRQIIGKALVGVRLHEVESAPATSEELSEWYFSVICQVDPAALGEWQRLRRGKRYRDYWFVFSAPIPDGETRFAIRWHSRSASPLPRSEQEAEDGRWSATPCRVRSLSRDSLVPRGGGSLDLGSKSVLLVGCGAVGSELALRLTSAGVGRLTISDPDKFSEDNLYRHVLSVWDIGRLKTKALAVEIARRYPWTEVEPRIDRLEELRDPAVLQEFDLILIAIGSPTVERVFADFCRQEELDVAVMTCWLEGHGIGGHVILTIPGAKGCWHCAYVDPKELKRGLTSNLNFLEPGQVVLHRHGGCGTQFLPYSGIAASRTATMAADLAVRFLAEGMTMSSKVSWKGDSAEAMRASVELTWRFRHFHESLRILPLHDPNCDLCSG